MYTDPEHYPCLASRKIEGNMVIFHYFDAGKEEDRATIQDMKHHNRGGLGDVKTKRYLLEILRESGSYYERRIEFARRYIKLHDMF